MYGLLNMVMDLNIPAGFEAGPESEIAAVAGIPVHGCGWQHALGSERSTDLAGDTG